MKRIKALCGTQIMVDDEDYPLLKRHKWYIVDNGNYVDVCTSIKKHTIYMPNLVFPEQRKTHYVMHIDGNCLNNTKANFESVHINHRRHTAKRIGEDRTMYTSKYRGVCRNTAVRGGIRVPTGTWIASIAKNGVDYYLGAFQTEELAAKAYNEKAKELYGKHAFQNIIQ